MTDKDKIRELIEKRYEYWKEKEFNSHSIESEIRMSECQHLLLMINSLQEESVSVEDLEEAVKGILKNIEPDAYHTINQGSLNEREEPAWSEELVLTAIKAGAQWQLNRLMKDSIKTTIKAGTDSVGILVKGLDSNKYSFGDKVRLIIIKQEKD